MIAIRSFIWIGRRQRPTSWALSLLASGLMAQGAAAATAPVPYEEVYAKSSELCGDALDQASINRCAWEIAEKLEAYEVLVVKAARESVVHDTDFYDASQRRSFAAAFDKGVAEWRNSTGLECNAAGIAMNGTGTAQVVGECVARRTDEHIRGLIEDYRLQDQFGSLATKR